MHTYSIYPKQFNHKEYKFHTDTCFVIMPFSYDLDNTYMTIETVATGRKIQCVRADNISTTSEPILSKICTQISQAYFIIVDITNLNPNVFYELGIAHVLRDANKVLIIKEEQTLCPSDISHLHYYEYSKSNLKHLKEIIEKFFDENNIFSDLYSILNFLDLLPNNKELSENFIVSLSDCIKDDMDCLIMLLNNQVTSSMQTQTINLLTTLTVALNDLQQSSDLYSLYSELILFIISKIGNAFDISKYISQLFSSKFLNISNEWFAECSILILDNSLYFDKAFSWIMEYLKQVSPAEFDVAKYKIEIGIIKSKSEFIDTVLINDLKSQNKTLVEHCIKLIKERKTKAAIPILLELVEKEENPYVFRSSLDALIKIASLQELLKAQKKISERNSYVESYWFLNKHITDLHEQISHLQKLSDY